MLIFYWDITSNLTDVTLITEDDIQVRAHKIILILANCLHMSLHLNLGSKMLFTLIAVPIEHQEWAKFQN